VVIIVFCCLNVRYGTPEKMSGEAGVPVLAVAKE